MKVLSRINALRQQIAEWRQQGLRIAFVPTMGNLHQGHLQLVREAQQQADRVVVSIFVNPTQFGPNEDFARYPRTEAEDQALLQAIQTDMLFLPAVEEIYPHASLTRIQVAELSDRLCGAHRPGHFDGVALVVCKLLNMVQPDVLLLGEKDFQQLAVIRVMVQDLNIPVTVQGVATVRADDGLALSSRNAYLSDSQRALAPMLYQTLVAIKNRVLAGEDDFLQLCQAYITDLRQAGFDVDYLEVCCSATLRPASVHDHALVVLIAARLGSTRLIDNLSFER